MKLPEKLGKEPLVEALFDVRFKSGAPIANILPGLVLSKFDGKKVVEKLPAADLPEQFLVSLDANFRYQPVVKIHWEKFAILSSNRSAGLACKLPYPGWAAGFKPAILKLMSLISDAKVVDAVERFSLKYTNLIPIEFGGASSVVSFTLKIGPHDLANNLFQTRAEFPKDNLISIVQIASHGTATLPDGTKKSGVLVDVDTISMMKDLPFTEFYEKLSNQLETAHTEAKSIFFTCLKPDLIAKLEPNYG